MSAENTLSTSDTMRHCIAVDAMGGDHGPKEVVAAIQLALDELPLLEEIILVGPEDILRPLLLEAKIYHHPKVRLFHASQVVEMEEKPIQSLKQKKDASVFRGIELIKSNQAQALVSQGNTGSLMAGSTLKLRQLDGIERPALATIWPSLNQHFVLIDSGANPDAKPLHLAHNAILGAHYCRLALKIETPRVGLLTIGTEEGKGNELINETHPLLKQLSHMIDYVGPIEGFDVFNDKVDVVVCDGFLGNVVLKSSEGLFRMIMETIKSELHKSWNRKLGALIAKPAFKAVKMHLNPDNYAGAPLLGLKGHVIKTHGSSTRFALLSAMRIALEMIQYDLIDQLHQDIHKANSYLKTLNTETAQ